MGYLKTYKLAMQPRVNLPSQLPPPTEEEDDSREERKKGEMRQDDEVKFKK